MLEANTGDSDKDLNLFYLIILVNIEDFSKDCSNSFAAMITVFTLI